MFGIFYCFLKFSEQVADSIYRAIQNHDGYNRGLERKNNNTDNTNTYFDWKGTRRDLDTHEIRNVDFDLVESYGQDRCVRDSNGNVIRNLSEEKRQKDFEAAKLNPFKTVSLYRLNGNGIYNGDEHRDLGGDGYCEGTQYKDLETGRIYVARTIGFLEDNNPVSATVYMDLQGNLIRETDTTKRERQQGVEDIPRPESIVDYIEKYNKTRIKKADLGSPNYNDAMYIHKLKKIYLNKKKIWGEI